MKRFNFGYFIKRYSSSIIAIESSCDDACISVLNKRGISIFDARKSTALLNRGFQGVFPHLSSSFHENNLLAILKQLFVEHEYKDFSYVCSTVGPGIYSCLSKGIYLGKILSSIIEKPFLGCHHMEGHLYSSLELQEVCYPFIGVLISGGHSMIVLAESFGSYIVLSKSLDDSVGEAFDKFCREIPVMIRETNEIGGHIVEALASKCEILENSIKCKETKQLNKDFSISGLKTEYIRKIKSLDSLSYSHTVELCKEYQVKLTDIIIESIEASYLNLLKMNIFPRYIVLGGGVSRNNHLKSKIEKFSSQFSLHAYYPKPEYSVDNAIMIGKSSLLGINREYANSLKYPIPNFPLGFLKDDDEALENYK